MESLNILSCRNCNEKFTEVYMLPCIHNFCSKCTNLMKNGTETTCLICSNSCHQDEVKRNAFLEKICLIKSQDQMSQVDIIVCELCKNQADKYCVDCTQYICLECSARHVKSKVFKDHKIIDKDHVKNVTINMPEPYCEKHETKFTIYCKTCDILICPTCCIFEHSDHDKSDNLIEVFSDSYSDIKNKIIEIDNMIKDQNNLIKENKVLETNLFQNCDKVRNEIENYTKELKDQIDNLTKANVDKIISFKNDFIIAVQAKLKEISDYIYSLTNLKSYFHEVIQKGSKVDVFNSKKEFNKNSWIKTMKPKIITKIDVSFHTPTINTLISTELSKSLKLIEMKDNQVDDTNNANVTEDLLPLKKQDFTLEQLKKYNGKGEDKRILLAINGKVFDVTKESKFYGADGRYGVFGGRDASRGLATVDFKPGSFRDEYDDLADLTLDQKNSLEEWEKQFRKKYQLVGNLLKPGEVPKEYTDADSN